MDVQHEVKASLGQWVGVGFHLGERREAYDTELTVIQRGIQPLDGRQERGIGYTVITDSQVAMLRIQNDAPGWGRDSQPRPYTWPTPPPRERGDTVTVRWALGQRGKSGGQ